MIPKRKKRMKKNLKFIKKKKLKDLKTGTKLLIGFTVVLTLTTIVGAIGYSGISKIVYQLEISKTVNRIIVDAGDAQAGSLRYIIYGEDKYHEITEEEAQNIMNQSKEVENLLLSDANKEKSKGIYNAIESYSKDNESFVKLENEKQQVGIKRTAAALEATNEIINAIDAAKDYSLKHKGDYYAVERVFMTQDARNAMNRIRITANKYVANPSDELENLFKNEITDLNTLLVKAKKMMASSKTKDALAMASAAVENYNNDFIAYKQIVEKQQTIQAHQRESASSLLSEARALREGVYNVVGKTRLNAYTFLIAVIVMAITLGIVVGLTITRSITLPLSKGVSFAQAIAKGDLTQKLDIDQKDEIGVLGNALNDMLNKLKEVVASVFEGTNYITGATQQMSTSSEQLSQGASEQASSVEEMSSTMEEITSNIVQNTENAKETEKIASEALSDIKMVKEKSLDAVKANRIIGDKIQIINDIAFQTNILALNAAVEAARAGEQGRGFSVVASEVRNLAERSKVAAEEIVGAVTNSIQMNEQAGDLLINTLPKIDKTAELVKEISAASVEQSSGVKQLNNALQQINIVTQENAASSEELAGNSEEMASQAEQLSEQVSFFKLDEGTRQKSDKVNLYSVPQNKLPQTKNNGHETNKSNIDLDLKTDSEYTTF